jgi:arylsulfatase A-like enzyme
MKNFLKKYVFLWFALFTIPFQELVFALTMGESTPVTSRAVLLLFSAVYGLVLYLLGTITQSTKANKIIRTVLLALTAVPFLIWNFIYAEFRMLYDIPTTFGGASDALGGFAGDIFRLVFSVNGIAHITLFLLPCLLYAFWGRRLDDGEPVPAKNRCAVLGSGCLLWAVCLIFLRLNPPLAQVYGVEYQFGRAVADFGLCTGLRLDIRNLGVEEQLVAVDSAERVAAAEENTVAADDVAVFDRAEVTHTETTAGEESGQETPGNGEAAATEAAEPEVDTSPNVLDIDFDALEEGASENLIEVDEYVRSLEPTNKNAYTGLFEGKNLIFITAEAFTAEVIDPELTPTLYRLATKGINFTDYYQPASAGTTGGEYANLMGMLPTAGGKSMKNTKNNHNYMTIGSLLNDAGYYGKAFHNNSYTYYDRDKTHVNLGYSDGYMGYGNGMEEYVEKTWPESDLEMIEGTLPTYIDKQPFNIYYMSVSGHSDYGRDLNAMSEKHWSEVENLDYSDTVKAYLAAQLELEAALTYLVDELENAGIADDTVICISADHFPYGLDENESGAYEYLSELYGYEVTDDFERDHNRLILWSGSLEDAEPVVVDTPTFSPDILPTLCNLFGIEYDSRLLPGRDVFSDAEALVYDLSYNWKTEYGTYDASTGRFTPADDSVVLPDGYVERIRQIVKNKINYSKKVLSLDYYAHVFQDKE